ncbi:hypothetical protein C8Q79DRAFT_745974 [Trametes meyenii]|nr:hypothetical protein C8Q79DRAFT_745974 [Trametes meyenii]
MDDYEDDVYYSVGGGSAAGDFADEDDMYFPRANAVFATESKDSDAQNGGGGEEDEDEDEDENVAQNPLLCPEHNIVCKKGICKVYAARKREEERNKRREEREKEREQARAKREKNVKKGKNSVFKSEPSSEPNGTSTPGSSSARSPPPHLRVGAAVPTPRAPPPHLKAGAPPPPPSSSTRPLPPHLQRGASAPSGPASPSPPGHQDGRVTPTQEHAGQDDARSESSGWGNPSEGPWGPTTNPGWNRTLSAPARAPAPASVPAPRPALPTPTHQAWGAWGKAPSISASSVRRNNDSWSVSAHSTRDGKNGANAKGIQQPQKPQQQQQQQQQWGAWGRAPSISASSVRRNNDSWSVSALSAAAKGDADNDDDARSVAASDTSGWGRPPSVVGARRTWADQMDDEDDKAVHARAAEDDDVRSVAASTESGWGNPSVGPW